MGERKGKDEGWGSDSVGRNRSRLIQLEFDGIY